MRGLVRAGQSPPHQRPVRCASQPHAGAGHRRAGSIRGDRRRLLSRDPSPGFVPRMQPLLRTRFRHGAVALCVGKRDPRRGRPAWCGGAGHPRRHRAAEGAGPWHFAECRAVAESAPGSAPDEAELTALAGLLNGARRVTLFCGRGCAGAHDSLMRFADKLKSPMVHALGGKEHVEFDNPYDVGVTGFIGFSSGYAAMHACDVLLMLGTDFPYKQFLPTDAKIAQIDIRPENLGRRCKLDLGIVGDVSATIAALLPKLTAKGDRKHLDASVAHYKKARAGLDELARGTPGQKPIHPQYLARLLSEQASDDAVFTADVGTPTIWAARYLAMNGRRRLVGSWVHGSMANAMAHAIGVQASQPKRQVVSMSGDGGFAMLMGDLITLTQMKLPVKIVIFNNGVLGFVALEMKASGFVETGVDLQNPDFAAMARAMGIHAVRVEDPGE